MIQNTCTRYLTNSWTNEKKQNIWRYLLRQEVPIFNHDFSSFKEFIDSVLSTVDLRLVFLTPGHHELGTGQVPGYLLSQYDCHHLTDPCPKHNHCGKLTTGYMYPSIMVLGQRAKKRFLSVAQSLVLPSQ